jgi:hypothetical protein
MMALGFRKSFKIVPGVRLNVSRRGAGLSAGPRGAKVSANTRRQKRGSLSLFGMFWRKKL